MLSKTYVFLVTFLLITGLMDAKAQQFSTSSDTEADIIPRLSMKDAAFGITNQDKSVDLLFTKKRNSFPVY